MRSTKGRLTVAGAWLVLAGTPLLAQQPAPSAARPMPMGGMPMMECPMMSAMMHGPGAALQSGAALNLTAQQRTRLEALQRQVDAASKPSMDSMQAIHTQLIALGERPQLDESAARAALDRMGRVHTAMGLTMLRASHEVATILTPAQRDSLAAIAKRQMPKPGSMPMSGMPMSGMPMSGMPMHPTPPAGAPPKH